MAGAMRKMGVYLGLVEEDDEYRAQMEGTDGYDDYAPTGSQHSSYQSTHHQGAGPSHVAESYPQGVPAPSRREVAYATSRGQGPGGGQPSLVEQRSSFDYEDVAQAYRISSLCPSTYNEALVIGEHFRNGSPVIVNLTEMDDSQAKRLIDFSAGLTFGLRGRLEKVTNKVFLLSPQNIDVTAEDRARIAEGTFFNQS